MSNYISHICPACNTVFNEKDDIVVCPVCGTPHHRHCYNDLGHCVFEEKHDDGFQWEAGPSAVPGDGSIVAVGNAVCSHCGAENNAGDNYCCRCGRSLLPNNTSDGSHGSGYNTGNNSESSFNYGGFAPNDEIAGHKISELAAYVGPSSHYYIPRFLRFNSIPLLPGFSVSAFFFGPFYFFYRKLYSLGMIQIILWAANFIPSLLLASRQIVSSAQLYGLTIIRTINFDYDLVFNISSVLSLVLLSCRIVMSMFAVKSYYVHVIRSVSQIKMKYSPTAEPQRFISELYSSGGVDKKHTIMLLIAAAAVIILSSFGLIYYMTGTLG